MANSEKLGKGVRFERIRRITGYLVGTTDRWNNAKKAEERDRVKEWERKRYDPHYDPRPRNNGGNQGRK